MKVFCNSLRKYAANIIDFEKKKMLSLTKKGAKIILGCKECFMFEKIFIQKLAKYRIPSVKLETIAILVNIEV